MTHAASSRRPSAAPPALPAWLGRDEVAARPWPEPGTGQRSGVRSAVLRQTLNALTGLLRLTTAPETVPTAAPLPFLARGLRNLNTQAKLLATGVLLLAAALTPSLAVLAIACLLTLAVAAGAGLFRHPAAGWWLLAPLYAVILAAPATLNLTVPGTPVLLLCQLPAVHGLPGQLTITLPGLAVAGRLVLRVTLCATLAWLSAATTAPHQLLNALRGLGVPRLAVLLLNQVFRYLDVLARAATELYLARLSRRLAPDHASSLRTWVAGGMGALFRRSRVLGQEVHLAMLSRGWTGEAHPWPPAPPWRAADCFTTAAAALAATWMLLG